jgi:hypothetical protein
VAAVGGRLRAHFPALSSLSLSLSALAALSSEEAGQLTSGLGACGATLTSFSLHNRGSSKYYPPSFCCCNCSYYEALIELRITHPSTMALRLTLLLASMPGLTTLDLRGLADLVGVPSSYCDCGLQPQGGFVEVFHVYSLLGGFTGRLSSLRLACSVDGSGLRELAASVDALAPSLRRLNIAAAEPGRFDEGYDSDMDDSGSPSRRWESEGTAFLGRLTSLEDLQLSGCYYNALPAWLAPLTRLTLLEAYRCFFKLEQDAALLAGLPRLRELSLQAFALQGAPVCAVAGVAYLTCLLSSIDQDALLAAFPGLIEADLWIYSPEAPGPAAVASAPAAPLAEHLCALTARVHLHLAGTAVKEHEELALEQLRQLLLGLPALRTLHVPAHGTIGGGELPPLLRASPALEELTLSGDLSSLDASAFAGCPRYPSLRALSLDDDGGGSEEPKKPPPQQALAGLTPAGLLALGRAFPRLARLSLGEGVSLERRRAWWCELRHAAATGSCSDAGLLRAVRCVLRHGAAHSVARAARKAA